MLDPPRPSIPCPAGAGARRAGRLALGAGALAALALGGAGMPRAQVPSVLQGGPPAQVIPTAPEPGIPLITINPGTSNPFAGLGGGLGPGGGGGGRGGSGGGGGGGNVGGPSGSLTTMLGTSWGAPAVDAAQSLGLNPSAVAAMCVVESGCRNVTNPYGYTGPFQMGQAAFNSGLATALAANPALASQIVQGPSGISDPGTNAVAAMGYMMQGVQALQRAGISDPNFVDVRGFHNFGPTYGVRVAQADGSELMGNVLPSSWLGPNGIGQTTTVAQWRDSVASKVGNAAGQSVRG